jgi:hypothetical protein
MIISFRIIIYNPPAKSSQNQQARSEIAQNQNPNPMLLCCPTKERTPIFTPSHSNSGIFLQVHLSGRIHIPSSTNIHKSIRIRHTNRNIRLALHKLHRQTLTSMPRDMTMQQPGAGIVFLEGDGQIAICRESSDVATRWVDEVKGAGVEVEDPGGLANYPEVVAVEMDWVVETDSATVLDHVDRPLVTGIDLLQ